MNLRRMQFTGTICAFFCAISIIQASQPTALVSWGSEYIPPLPADTKFKAISSGANHNLAIRSDDTVVAWGADHDGQCRVPVGLSDVVAVAAGRYYSLALKSDGTVVGWGFNGDGVITTPAGLTNVVAIAAGYTHSLALKNDGTVVSSLTNVPVPDGLSNVVAVAAGVYKSFALKADGTVFIWGNTNAPTTIASNIVAITHSLGLKDDGSVIGFDGIILPEGLTNIVAITSSSDGVWDQQLRHLVRRADGKVAGLLTDVLTGATDYFHSFDNFAEFADSIGIAAGNSHFLFLKADGTLATWGVNNYSQGVLPTGFNDITTIAAGYRHQVVLKKDGTIFPWGEGDAGQLYVPPDLTNVTAVAAGATYTAALRATGQVHISGGLAGKELLATLTNVVALAGGYFHAVFLDANGKVGACGLNTDGQLNMPIGLTNVVAIAAGEAHSVALRADGTAIAWGKISQDFTNYNDIVAIDASMLLRANGTTIHFGRDDKHTSPVSNAIAISSGRYHELVLTSDAKVIIGGITEHGRPQTYIAPEVKHVLAIEAGWGKSFAIVSIAPELRSQMSGGNLVLSWPVSTKTYTLQSTADVTVSDSWAEVAGDAVVANHRNTFTLPASGEQRYFRLVSVED